MFSSLYMFTSMYIFSISFCIFHSSYLYSYLFEILYAFISVYKIACFWFELVMVIIFFDSLGIFFVCACVFPLPMYALYYVRCFVGLFLHVCVFINMRVCVCACECVGVCGGYVCLSFNFSVYVSV